MSEVGKDGCRWRAGGQLGAGFLALLAAIALVTNRDGAWAGERAKASTQAFGGPSGATYYVNPSGSDSNSGTSPEHAWRTVSKVNSFRFQPGDVVYFARGGLWREMLNAAGGVTFANYGSGAQPIIDGADVVPASSWSPVPGHSNVYQATIASGTYIENLYVDASSTTGGPTGPAAQPALGGDPGWGLMRACGLPGTSVRTPGPKVGNPSGVFPANAGACQIRAMQPGSYVFYPAGTRPKSRSGAAAGVLYVELGDDSNPASHTIEIADRIAGLYGAGNYSEYADMVVTGLTFQHARSGILVYSNHLPGQSNVTVENCTVRYTGTGQMDDSYNGGIVIVRGASPIVKNNVLSYTGSHGNAVNLQMTDNAQYLNNTADHWNHHCMDSKNSQNALIQGNTCHDAYQPPAGSDSHASSNYRNAIYQESPSGYGGCTACTGLVVQENIVYNVSGDGILINKSVGRGVRIYNNSIRNVGINGIAVEQAGDYIENNTVDQAAEVAVNCSGGVWATEHHNQFGRYPNGKPNTSNCRR